jgi:threonylcarbamoyladenosine tRNA methylthiotransferase MtaB
LPSVAFHTLGCKLNFAETGTIADQFKARDFEVVPFGSPADVVILNTCTVTEEADRKCRQSIRKALRANENACVIVTGCFAQLRPEQIAGIPGVDVVLGANEKFDVFRYVDAFAKREQTQIDVSCIDDVTEYGAAFSASERTRAFLKVQDGCDYSCSFCTIPMARGKSRSAVVSDLVDQAKAIADRGFKEIVLSGVNIGLFGQERGDDLLSLLRELDQVEGISRYRISSCEPNLLTDEIIDFVASSRAFMPHFHLPLQSGDDFVLGKMRRRYRTSDYRNRVDRVLSVMPDAAIGVDVIVGFPAEGPDQFEATYAFIESLPVSYLHVFTYSERPETVAVDQIDSMGGAVVEKRVRSERNRRLRVLSEKKKGAFYTRFTGQQRPVLWESAESDGRMSGFTDNHVRVEAAFDEARTGSIEVVQLGRINERGHVQIPEMELLPIL